MVFNDIRQLLKFCCKSRIRPEGNQNSPFTLSNTLVCLVMN
jgi:hypothetical protein